MAMDRAAMLKKIAESTANSGGTNIRDGRGRLVVKRLLLDDKYGGATFVAEFVVVSSSKTPVTELKTGKSLDITPNEQGSDVSWVQMLDKHASAAGNVKGFLLELYGSGGEEISDDDFIATLDEVTKENTAKGMVIDFSTYRKITKEKQTEICIPKWSAVEQTPEDIKRMLAWMDSLLAAQKAANAAAPTATA